MKLIPRIVKRVTLPSGNVLSVFNRPLNMGEIDGLLNGNVIVACDGESYWIAGSHIYDPLPYGVRVEQRPDGAYIAPEISKDSK